MCAYTISYAASTVKPPREAAALLQRVGVRVFVEEGEVVQVGFVQPA